MTFTKEQLINQAREEVDFWRERDELIPSQQTSIRLRLAEITLAALTSEPVGEIVLGEYDDSGCHPDARVVCIAADGQADWENFKDGNRLYAAPPAPVMPDIGREQFEEWFKFHHGEEGSIVTLHRANGGANYRDEFVDLAWIAWKDSRAAMLHGAIVGNAPAHYDLRPEQNNSSPAQSPIDHGYRPDCECSGCRGLAAIFSDLNGRSPVITGCWCHTCRPVAMTDMRLVVCPTCGNKRCPHANDHRNACTGSNEPGQEGSAYPAAPQQEVK